MKTTDSPFPLPIHYLGIVLGLAALSLAWHNVAPDTRLSIGIREGSFALASLIWLSFMSVYAWKWCHSPLQAKSDLQHPQRGSFVSLMPITTLLIGLGAMAHVRPLAMGLIALGIFGQLAFATYYIAGMWRGTQQAEFITPVMYLPTVATNFVSAIALDRLGYQEIGMLFFGAGFFSWLMLEPAVLQRLRTLQPVPEPLRLGLGIQLAPAFVACSAYLALNGGKIDIFAIMLMGYGLLQGLFLLRLLPWLFKAGFTPAVWAFSFGLASLAKVSIFVYQQAQDPCFAYLGLGLFAFANVAIALMLVGTFYLLFKRRFLVK